MPSLNISLSPEMMELIDQKVVDGAFASPSDVISEALRRFDSSSGYPGVQASQLPRMRRAIQQGLEAIDRGEVVEESIDDILAEARREAVEA